MPDNKNCKAKIINNVINTSLNFFKKGDFILVSTLFFCVYFEILLFLLSQYANTKAEARPKEIICNKGITFSFS